MEADILAFNQTRMELKRTIVDWDAIEKVAFNQTRMELKLWNKKEKRL